MLMVTLVRVVVMVMVRMAVIVMAVDDGGDVGGDGDVMLLLLLVTDQQLTWPRLHTGPGTEHPQFLEGSESHSQSLLLTLVLGEHKSEMKLLLGVHGEGESLLLWKLQLGTTCKYLSPSKPA